MFNRILIANRGEIACRIITTCRTLGIATVAVHSDADEDALHVRMADESFPIGPPPPAESYLAIDRIIDALVKSGAEAVHPGFGFLAENARFVEAVEAAGAVFIGPPARAVAAMGDKIESKRIAEAAGVSVVPGSASETSDVDEALAAARDIGYPVMVKPAAGGGGKGMRVVGDDDELVEGFRASRSEAATAFGDTRIFLEKFITQPRHVEIQILADNHGAVVALNERECSIQRRHQKVVEEAPSPLINETTRRAMAAEACALARAVNYRSAGTVEFVVDPDSNFYFLEMNTRLQVEHPVTEFITGVDIVEQMIRIATGERLAFTAADVGIDGWSIEARIYAEDSRRGFLPSIGRLITYRPPQTTRSLRIDSGVEEGSEVTMFYDPMIAKLVVHGEDRRSAIAAMRHALDSFEIRGVQHNIDFLAAIMRDPRFAAGDFTTAFIDSTWPDGFSGAPVTERERTVLTGVGLLAHLRVLERNHAITGTLRESGPMARDWVVQFPGEQFEVTARLTGDGIVWRNGERDVTVESSWSPGQTLFQGEVDGRPAVVQVQRKGTSWELSHAGISEQMTVLSGGAAKLLSRMPARPAADLSRLVTSPMPGRIVELAVEEGEAVETGQVLIVIDAMKMENVLRAERAGEIARVHVAVGDSVSVDSTLLEYAGRPSP
ncbi:MAG: acetyl/propionyl/methylcrotonyl-CoA carboxylase subunit alpha [Alphaproteobacteria bacterium]|nr:acetyl/propionyl/methylcrotonyl-CoA carboxylase subunit alpha [Alphaproteobacteria bacterium]